MGKTADDVYKYSSISVVVFGILGNSLVIVSILRQKKLLKNNYYFFVLHLAICDLAYLVGEFVSVLNRDRSVVNCVVLKMKYAFLDAGIYMMLIISMLRYQSTVHPLRPGFSRRKFKLVSGFGYIFGLIVGYGASLPRCLLKGSEVETFYGNVYYIYVVICFFLFPTVFMAVVYHRIGRALIKQNKHMKNSFQSNAARIRYVGNRRRFLVCLVTVLCYGVGTLPNCVWIIWRIATGQNLPMKWLKDFGSVLRVAGSNSVNPLIYGILDKKLVKFWKRRQREEQIIQET